MASENLGNKKGGGTSLNLKIDTNISQPSVGQSKSISGGFIVIPPKIGGLNIPRYPGNYKLIKANDNFGLYSLAALSGIFFIWLLRS